MTKQELYDFALQILEEYQETIFNQRFIERPDLYITEFLYAKNMTAKYKNEIWNALLTIMLDPEIGIPCFGASIPNFTFYEFQNFPEPFIVPDNVKLIETWAFRRCDNVHIILSEGFQRIEVRAFDFCKNLDITIPEDIITIDRDAFADSTGILWIPAKTAADAKEFFQLKAHGTMCLKDFQGKIGSSITKEIWTI